MRTQPQHIIQKLEADNSRLAKEAILLEAMQEGLDEFFEGCKMALDPLHTFGVKQVPTRGDAPGQGCSWQVFSELAKCLIKTGFSFYYNAPSLGIASPKHMFLNIVFSNTCIFVYRRYNSNTILPSLFFKEV